MGVVHINSEFTAFCIGNSIIIYNHRTSETQVLNELDIGEKQPASENNGDSGKGNIVAASTSPSGKYFVVACDTKVAVVWCTQSWTQLASHMLIKRPMALAVTRDSSTLLVADKSGDVYEFPMLGERTEVKDTESPSKESEVEEFEEPGGHKPLLGHLSMLLDVVVTEDNKYVITCDRDEKIRVSHYPSAYDIHTFCLGHQEFVSQVSILAGNPHKLLSCSGDGTLRLWDYVKGECVCCVDTREQLQHRPDLLQQYLNHRNTKMTQHRSDDTNTGKHKHKADEEKTGKQEEIRKTLPDYPAVKCMAVGPSVTKVHLVAALLDKIPAIFLYKVDDQQMMYISTLNLSSEPHTAAWINNTELVVTQSDVEEKVRVFRFWENVLEPISEHPMEEVGKKYKDYFKGWCEPLDVDVLYKQRYDNVADYLKKKEERLAIERAAQDGLMPPLKKGRWVK